LTIIFSTGARAQDRVPGGGGGPEAHKLSSFIFFYFFMGGWAQSSQALKNNLTLKMGKYTIIYYDKI